MEIFFSTAAVKDLTNAFHSTGFREKVYISNLSKLSIKL